MLTMREVAIAQPRELPILFSAPMVRAERAGLKTQTRRVVKMPHGLWETSPSGELVPIPVRCPYGQPGDLLWVREAWTTHKCFDHIPPRDLKTRSIHYVADGQVETGKYRQGFHMPRWASRILLEVTEVRIEKLGEISEADAIAEGVSGVAEYRDLWASINKSWEPSTWVWVIQFRRV
jgi:hypothetical protein